MLIFQHLFLMMERNFYRSRCQLFSVSASFESHKHFKFSVSEDAFSCKEWKSQLKVVFIISKPLGHMIENPEVGGKGGYSILWSNETIKEARFIFLFHCPEYTSPEGSCPQCCKLVTSYNQGYTLPHSYRQEETNSSPPNFKQKSFLFMGPVLVICLSLNQ